MLKSKAIMRRLLAAVALAGMLIPATGGSAGALSPLPIICTAAGTVTFVNGDIDSWQVQGRGSCQGDLEGTYFLDFLGSGGSDTLGVCDESLLVQNLNINVVGSLTNAETMVPKFFNLDWTAPVTTYPLVTPFIVETNGDEGGPIGAGAFFNHIFLQCNGPTVAQFTFALFT